jgi:hypothetical protein
VSGSEISSLAGRLLLFDAGRIGRLGLK